MNSSKLSSLVKPGSSVGTAGCKLCWDDFQVETLNEGLADLDVNTTEVDSAATSVCNEDWGLECGNSGGVLRQGETGGSLELGAIGATFGEKEPGAILLGPSFSITSF